MLHRGPEGEALKAWALSLLLMFAAGAGCAEPDQPGTKAAVERDGDDGALDDGSARSRAHPEFHFSLIALFLEVERGARAECPCWVQTGQFDSVEACIEMMSLRPGWQECVGELPLPDESDDINDQLYCSLEQLKTVNDCVEAAECEPIAAGACRQLRLDCQTASQTFLSGVVNACPGSGTARR